VEGGHRWRRLGQRPRAVLLPGRQRLLGRPRAEPIASGGDWRSLGDFDQVAGGGQRWPGLAKPPYDRGMRFARDSFIVGVPEHQLATFDAAWQWLSEPSGAWTADEKLAMVDVARNASPRLLHDRRPATIDHLSSEVEIGRKLSPLVVDTVERVAVEAGAICREWASAVIDVLGDTAYAELVAVIATVTPIDRACELLGRPVEPLPDPLAGLPTGERADPTVDIGAYVPAAQGFAGPNVAKSLSVAPTANLVRLGVVRALYSGTRFGELRWDDGALNRPQVELVAARTSALNECFY